MAIKPLHRQPSSKVEPDERGTLEERVATLEKLVNEILDTYSPKLADRVHALEATLQRHGIRPPVEN